MYKPADFDKWLAAMLNRYSASLRGYASYAQESPPDGASAIQRVLQAAWDARALLVGGDSAYQNLNREVSEFSKAHAQEPTRTPEEREALYVTFLNERGSAGGYSIEEVSLRRDVADALLAALAGDEAAWERIETIWEAEMYPEGEEEDAETESGAHAVVYLYDDEYDAAAAYEGRQPAFDRANNLVLLRWPSTPTALNKAALRAGLSRILASEHAAKEGFEGYVADRVEELLNPEFTDAERTLLRELVERELPQSGSSGANPLADILVKLQ